MSFFTNQAWLIGWRVERSSRYYFMGDVFFLFIISRRGPAAVGRRRAARRAAAGVAARGVPVAADHSLALPVVPQRE